MTRLSNGVVVFAGLLAQAPVANVGAHYTGLVRCENDPRLTRLQRFLSDYNSPVYGLAEDFLIAADNNELDWRLLPSIALVESGAGKEYRNNNILGWDSCRRNFPSIQAGIHTVAGRLRNSKLYKDKDLDEVLHTYNTDREYADLVKSLMESLGPPDPGRALN